MTRSAPENRFKDLVSCASRLFVAQGYRHTQMADVAREMGVAKGTPYLYVESKEALFSVCLVHADGEAPAVSELDLPIPTPRPGAVVQTLREALEREVEPKALRRALRRRRVPDARTELEEILREMYAASQRHRTAIKLLTRCAEDLPELGQAFMDEGRFRQVELLSRYLQKRIESGLLRPVPDPAAAARFAIEAIATWAVHVYWDPAPQGIDPRIAEETVVQFLLGGFLEE
jgi:AcrR family transcriptional regulator